MTGLLVDSDNYNNKKIMYDKLMEKQYERRDERDKQKSQKKGQNI